MPLEAWRYVDIRVDYDKDQRHHRDYPYYIRQIENLKPILEGGADVIAEVVEKEAFGKEGPGWKVLSEETVKQREYRIAAGEIDVGPRRPILQQTRRMRFSLTRKGHPDHIRKVTRDTLVYGTRVKYAIYHQYGTRRMPARTILQGSQITPKLSRYFQDQIPMRLREDRGIRAGRRRAY